MVSHGAYPHSLRLKTSIPFQKSPQAPSLHHHVRPRTWASMNSIARFLKEKLVGGWATPLKNIRKMVNSMNCPGPPESPQPCAGTTKAAGAHAARQLLCSLRRRGWWRSKTPEVGTGFRECKVWPRVWVSLSPRNGRPHIVVVRNSSSNTVP